MYKREIAEVVEELDELRRNYNKESIRKRNVLMDQIDSLKGIVDERDNLRAQIDNFKIERDSINEKLEKITKERNVLRLHLSRCLSGGTYSTSCNDTTTGVNVETITFTSQEEE